MNLKKSKASVHKLFWALCILGSGIHVHAVESSTEARKVFVRQLNKNIDVFVRHKKVHEADRRFCDALKKRDLELMKELIRDESTDGKVSQETVNDAFIAVTWTKVNSLGEDIMNWLLKEVPQERQVTQKTVNHVFHYADLNYKFDTIKRRMNWLLKEVSDERQVTPETVNGTFSWAAKDGNVDAMNWLLKEVPQERKVTAQTVGDALNRAARMGHEGVVQYLTSDECLVKPKNGAVESALLGAAEHGHTKTVKYLLSHNRINIDQQVLQDAFDGLVSKMDLKDFATMKNFAEIHFPKEIYENSEKLSNRLDDYPLSEDQLKAIMAIRTEDGQISSFTHYLLESVLSKDKQWLSKKEAAAFMEKTEFMSEQHYQDAMAVMKLRQRGATKVSKLPGGVFRHMLEYVEPNIAVKSNEEDQAKKGGQQNDLGLID